MIKSQSQVIRAGDGTYWVDEYFNSKNLDEIDNYKTPREAIRTAIMAERGMK